MTDVPLQQRFAEEMGRLLGPEFPTDIGLAVSGGGDSMAMLYLAHNWTHQFGVRLWVATIDHGLRAQSAAEARMVADECRLLGWPHATLQWHWDQSGNVQDAARRARLALLDRWRGPVKHVLLAHTQDDQAETVLMRLARGSGVDGLAGMKAARGVAPHAVTAPPFDKDELTGTCPSGDWTPGYRIVRPCLGMMRQELRHYATTLKGRWVDDPTNEDPTYQRVRMRKLVSLLQDEGITPTVLTDTAQRMARARDGLTARLAEAVDSVCQETDFGQVVIDRDAFAGLDTETQLRMLTSGVCYVAASEYRPRARASERLLELLLSGRGGTLHGAELLIEKSRVRITRELSAVASKETALATLWDDQWLVTAHQQTAPTGLNVRALGEDGWCQIPDRENTLIPHRAALALPSVWRDNRLLWCPLFGDGAGFVAQRFVCGHPDAGFKAFCLSH